VVHEQQSREVPYTVMVPQQQTYTVNRPNWVSVPYDYQVTLCREETRSRTVRVARQINETQTREVPYTVCVPQPRTETYNVTICRTVPEERTVNYTVMVPQQVERQVQVRVCNMVPRTITCQVPVYNHCNYNQGGYGGGCQVGGGCYHGGCNTCL
jgi:hypothetical protein